MNNCKTIQEMLVGETGMITGMENVEQTTRHRFMDLGIAPYSKVKLLKKMNFNNLYVIDVDDVEICIRQKDAKKITIKSN